MSPTLRDVLAREANDTGAPDLDLDAMVALGEDRLRRRRTTALLGSAASVVVVVALALGVLTHDPAGRSTGPVDHPSRPATTPPAPLPVREIVWSDGYHGTRIHLGDRVVRVPESHVHMDVTDDGIVYVGDGGRLWFSDGGPPRRIAARVCGAAASGQPGNFATDLVVTANAGSLAAWFDCGDPEHPSLVVLETTSSQVVARQPMPACEPPQSGLEEQRCDLVGVVGDRVYLTRERFCDSGGCRHVRQLLAYDVSTRTTSVSSPRTYAADLRAHPRALLVGRDAGTAEVTDGVGQVFRVAGRRLVPVHRRPDGVDVYPSKVWVTTTRKALGLRLPDSFQTEPGRAFRLFEWLDDDTVALVDGEVLRCTLSTGRCVVAVPATEDTKRVVPEQPLPG